MRFEALDFLRMTEDDIPILTPVMTRAFNEDSRLYFPNPVGGPPGYDDGSFLRKWGLESDAIAYRINLNGEAIGAVIIFLRQETKEGILGCIFVDRDLEHHGYGAMIWRFIEHTYPAVKTWYTETPAVSFRNHCFYINKLSFHVLAVEGKERFDAQFKMRKIIN